MVLGWLYVEAPVRICNAYLADEQSRTGFGLLAVSMAGSLFWLYAFFVPAGQVDDGDNGRSLYHGPRRLDVASAMEPRLHTHDPD